MIMQAPESEREPVSKWHCLAKWEIPVFQDPTDLITSLLFKMRIYGQRLKMAYCENEKSESMLSEIEHKKYMTETNIN